MSFINMLITMASPCAASGRLEFWPGQNLKIVIIGSSGYVGKRLCNAHVLRGDEVVELSSSGNGINPITGLFKSGFSIHEGTDVVYYLAQSPCYRSASEGVDHLLCVNCVAAVQAAEAARLAGVGRFIYASTGNVYKPSFEPLSESGEVRRDAWYPLSKLMAEDALKLYRSSMKVTIARIFGVYGPGQTNKLVPFLVQSLKARKPLFVDRNPNKPDDINGLQVSLIYIDDLVAAFMHLADHISPVEIVNVGGEQAVSVCEIVTILGHQLGIEPSITVSMKNRDGNLIADVALIKALTGIEFTNIEDGVAKMLTEAGSR